MDNFQMGVASVLLNGMLALTGSCPPCSTGFFLIKNCSSDATAMTGIQCELCTNCSVNHLETLVPCSAFKDSVCGDRIRTAVPGTPITMSTQTERESSPSHDGWFLPITVSVSVVLIFLLLLIFSWLSHRKETCTRGLYLP